MTPDNSDNDLEQSGNERSSYEDESPDSSNRRPPQPKKVVFDDFQITRSQQERQVEEEKRVWKERQERIEQKPAILKAASSRLRSVRDEMIGSLFKKKEPESNPSGDPYRASDEPYFAEHEKSVIVTRRASDEEIPRLSNTASTRKQEKPITNQSHVTDELRDEDRSLIEEYYGTEDESDSDDIDEFEEATAEEYLTSEDEEELDAELEDQHQLESDEAFEDQHDELEEMASRNNRATDFDEEVEDLAAGPASFAEVVERTQPAEPTLTHESNHVSEDDPHLTLEQEPNVITDEPEIEPSLKSFLDSLRSFDSHPRRAHESRDPRTDFVTLLSELLDILREQVDATSAMFFWVNTKKQQLVLESAALDDRAYQFLAEDKRFPIELDAVSRVVTKKKPELHSIIQAQAELDLIPYYRDSIGIASFAGMPVLFGDGLVGVLTVDSCIEENFTQETLRILTTYSKLLSGLIRSYIEKYDLLASARTLESARKLHQIVSPDTTQRVLREQRKNPDYILRALTEAAGEISDWDWLATASFDDSRRLWSINALQSKHNGSYVPPQTPISLAESIVGKCLQSGRASRHDNLNAQSIRYNIEEDRSSAVGHSFMVIPIRTTNKNYGALAIEHSERSRFTDADVETLEHLSRSAAAALEIIALSEIVGERALTDLLTGVLNKRGLLQRLNQELARAMQFDEPLTLALFEIDGAAEFFARFAQEDSDTIVLAITRLLRFGSREFDVIARVGEHSFAAVMIQMSDEDAYLWSEKMRKMIVSEVIAIGKRSFSVTVSIGVSGARRDGTVEELIEGAELAIERAREMGGNNVIVY